MSMTRKDYQLIADALKGVKPGELGEPMYSWDVEYNAAARAKWHECVEAVTAALRQTNPRFDNARFLAACGVEDV